LLVGTKDALHHVGFPDSDRRWAVDSSWRYRTRSFKQTKAQLDEYFDGKRRLFDLTLELTGTQFQKRVWQSLLDVHYGETGSYGQLAAKLGQPNASRAVGAANGANPIPIIIPCHRIIGASGKLTGFGGGLGTKQWLLDHERGQHLLFDAL